LGGVVVCHRIATKTARLGKLLNRETEGCLAADTAGLLASRAIGAPRPLDYIGCEPLAGSGFENEQPESECAPAGEENGRPWQHQ